MPENSRPDTDAARTRRDNQPEARDGHPASGPPPPDRTSGPELEPYSPIDSAQARAAARTVASRFPGDPQTARMVLEMLGIRDRLHRHPDPSEVADLTEPTGSRQHLVDTKTAAEALSMLEPTLNRFAQARIVRPSHTDADGTRWWSLPDVRSQISAYLGDADDAGRPG